jgi:hypothetical protein
MRTIMIAMVLALAACSGGGKSSGTGTGGGGGGGGGAGTGGFDRETYRCTPPEGVDGTEAAAACEAKPEGGCKYTQQLSCYGTEPPPDVEEAERRARESGSIGCACVCPSDEAACRMVP